MIFLVNINQILQICILLCIFMIIYYAHMNSVTTISSKFANATFEKKLKNKRLQIGIPIQIFLSRWYFGNGIGYLILWWIQNKYSIHFISGWHPYIGSLFNDFKQWVSYVKFLTKIMALALVFYDSWLAIFEHFISHCNDSFLCINFFQMNNSVFVAVLCFCLKRVTRQYKGQWSNNGQWLSTNGSCRFWLESLWLGNIICLSYWSQCEYLKNCFVCLFFISSS